jgi:hypothetical protein
MNGRRTPDDRARRTVRERARGWILLAAAAIGLVAEAVSTVQDGVSFWKVVALACFLFVFWYGWDLARPRRR